jgi:hypothetical protein
MQPERFVILSYQSITGLFEALLGALMVCAPQLALKPVLQFPEASLPFVSFCGIFIFALGLCGLIGALMEFRRTCREKLQVIWMVTIIIHSGSAVFVVMQVIAGTMSNGWLLIAVPFGILALVPALFIKFNSAAREMVANKNFVGLKNFARPSAEWRRWIH